MVYSIRGKTSENGQALLLVLLGMAVVLTMVLSIISRSITDISLTSKDEDSLRAFSAAEAGVEQALIIGSDVGETFFDNSSNFKASISDISSTNLSEFGIPGTYGSGQSATVWFVSHGDNENLLDCNSGQCFTGDFSICWGVAGVTPTILPAIEVTTFYDSNAPSALVDTDFSGVRVARAAFDPNTSRNDSNGFDDINSTTCTVDNVNYAYKVDSVLNKMNLIACSTQQGCPLFARIKFIYNTDPVPVGVVSPTSTFPSQGKIVSSTGTSGEAVRKIEVISTYKSPLSIFESGVFSPNSIEKTN